MPDFAAPTIELGARCLHHAAPPRDIPPRSSGAAEAKRTILTFFFPRVNEWREDAFQHHEQRAKPTESSA